MDRAPLATVPARTLPVAGTLTFLFTDVESSTSLWEQHETQMRAVIARHDVLLDNIIRAHDGQRVKERGEGDSLFAVFVSPEAAAAAALAIAQAVQAEPWPPQTPIRVRLGLHTGSAQWRAGDYYGTVVNRCARIRSLGHGGQALLSSATAALVRDVLPQGASLRSLGAHSLKGLSEPEEVFQLCHPALPAAFPPLRSPQAPTHNLPLALTELIGREAEQGEVLALLAQARLVTLVGAGGVGKTRLALAVAAELVDQYPDGVWLAELAPLAEERLVPGVVAQALGLREEPGRPLLATLTERLRPKHLVLVLDNCEHLVDACAQFAGALLRTCPQLRVLATSREALEIAGEQRYRVPSLSIPDPRHLPAPDLAGSYEAVRLFVARARERRPDFALSPQNARAVTQICARLDGIPLAIELAAARVGSLSVEGIATRLDDRFRLLTGGARDELPRQRTLRGALDWSYDLLAAPEQRLLDRLAVFAGGWTLDAAEAVCAGEGVEQGEILDLLDALVHKSLVQVEERAEGELRYALLETLRHYGQERLAASDAAPALRAAHAQYFAALAEEAVPLLRGPEQAQWLERLEMEHDNLRAALRWTQERGAVEAGLRLAAALWRFWDMHGHLSEGRAWLEAALTSGAGGTPAARAQALNGAGLLTYRQGDLAQAAVLHEESLTLRRTLGDRPGIAGSLNNLGLVAADMGDLAQAARRYEEALALLHELGDRWSIAVVLGNLGNAARAQGDLAQAGRRHEEALALARDLEDPQGLAAALHSLGNIAYDQGDLAQAARRYEEALALARDLEDRYGVALSLYGLGTVARQQGDLARAARLLGEALALRRELGDRPGITEALGQLGIVALQEGDWRQATAAHAQCLIQARDQSNRLLMIAGLEGLAQVAAATGNPTVDPPRAARLLGAAAAQRTTLGAPVPPVEQVQVEEARAAAHAALGEDAFMAAWAEGQALSIDDAIALALADTDAVLQGP